jgi:hypothetical protein
MNWIPNWLFYVKKLTFIFVRQERGTHKCQLNLKQSQDIQGSLFKHVLRTFKTIKLS